MNPEDPGDLHASFYGLAEEVTPYYQEQIGRLSPGQKSVMEFLAERWIPTSVSEIADGLFVDPVSVSGHLRSLRRDRLVVSTAIGKEVPVLDVLSKHVKGLEGWAQILFCAWIEGVHTEVWQWRDERRDELTLPDELDRIERGEWEGMDVMSTITSVCMAIDRYVSSGEPSQVRAMREHLLPALPIWLVARRDIDSLSRLLEDVGLADAEGFDIYRGSRVGDVFMRLSGDIRIGIQNIFSSLGLSRHLSGLVNDEEIP